jgi:hypothetical protein
MRAARADMVGSDLVRTRLLEPQRRQFTPALLAGLLLAALAVAALRVDLIRVRYGLADALSAEKTLLQERSEALAAMRTLRDPARLARLAARRGFVRPTRIVDLSPAPPGTDARP